MAIENQKEYMETDKNEVSLKQIIFRIQNLLRYLISKWLIIFLSGLIGGGLGFFYAYYKKPIYTATTTFVLADEKAGGAGLSSLVGLASVAGLDLGGGGGGIFEGDNILELYKSRTMIEKTLLTQVSYNGKNQQLIDWYIEFNDLKKSWKDPKLKAINFNLSASDNKFSRLQDSVISLIVNDISKSYLSVTKPDKKLSIIKADVKAKNEFFAKAFNDEIVKNVNDFYVQTKTKKSLANVNILQHKTDSVRAVMNGAIYTAAEVTDATPNLNPTRQTQRVAPVQRSQFAAETNKAVLSELLKNLELSKMSLLKETPLIQVIDVPVYPLYKDKLGKIKGLVIGGFLFGFITVGILLLRRIFSEGDLNSFK